MSSSFEFFFKPFFFGRKKLLKITPDFIELREDDSGNIINMSNLEIAEMRYGIKSIDGYYFRIGRIEGYILRLRFKSLYRINKKKLGTKYMQIVNALHKNFINDISIDYLKTFYTNTNFILNGIKFEKDGVRLRKTSNLIPWEDLGTRNYSFYFSLFSKQNPNEYKAYEYINDWNVFVIRTISENILKNKNLRD